jgi:hypothetical protein
MTFNRAWQRFVDEESSRCAPAELQARVERALAAPQPARPRRRYVVEIVAVAASISVAASWSIARSERNSPPLADRLAAGAPQGLASYAATAVRDEPRIVRSPVVTGRRHGRLSMSGASNPASSPEALQLVRLRLPRQALATLGLLLTDPESAGFVQVDVLVGEDGLPRNIRKVWFEP